MNRALHTVRQVARLVSGFSLSMAVMAVVGLLMMRAMIVSSGPEVWAAIATGQAIGTFASVIVGFGWAFSGPARIKVASEEQRRDELVDSLRLRLCLTPPVMVIGSIAAMVAVPGNRIYAVAGALATAILGLSASWYFAGAGQAYTYFFTETAIRVGFNVVGLLAMVRGGDALIGVVCQGVGSVVGIGFSTAWILRQLSGGFSGRSSRPPLRKLVQVHGAGFSSQLFMGLFASTPIVIVSALAPSALPLFAALDKLQKQFGAGLAPIVTAAQGLVPGSTRRETRRRLKGMMAIAMVAAAAVGMLVFLVGPWLLAWLTDESLPFSRGQVALVASLVGLNLLIALLIKACFPALGLNASAARAVFVGGVASLALVIVMVPRFGADGALAAMIFGQAVVGAVSIILLTRLR